MTLEEKIASLLSEAEPLRCLLDDDPAKERLTGIVDAINKARAEQSAQVVQDAIAVHREVLDEQAAAEFAAVVESVAPKRGPGRPKKDAA